MPLRALIKSRASRAVIVCVLTACACPLIPAQVTKEGSPPQLDAATEQLTGALIAAGSAAARRALLASAPPGAVSDALRATLVARGRAERGARRFAQAVACFEAAGAVAEFLSDRKGAAGALSELGETCAVQGEFERALEFFERGRALDAGAVDPLRLARVLFDAGAVYFVRGDYPRAMELYRRSLETYERGGGSKGQVAGILYGIGAIHYLKGEYAEATEIHRRGLKLAEESGGSGVVAEALFGLAADYRMQGDYAAALSHYERSLKLREQAGEDEIRGAGGPYLHARTISTVLRHIGTTHLLQGNYALALRYFERVLRRDEAAQDEEGIAYSLSYLGGVYRAQGRYEQALDHLERSLKLFEKLGMRDGVARTLATLGGVHQLRGDSERALEYFRRALELREQMDAKEGVAGALLGLATAHAARGEHAQALAAATRSAALARRIGSPHVLWGALLFAGRAHLALGRAAEARGAFDESIATVESLRAHVAGGEEGQELFFADKLAPYYEVTGMLVGAGRAEEAFAYAEAGKGRVLLDVLRAGRASTEGRLTAAEAERGRELRRVMNDLASELRREQVSSAPNGARVEELRARLAQARLEYSAFQATLDATHPELRVERGAARPVTRADVAGLLTDDDTAVAEYVVTEQRTHLFVFTKGADGTGAALTIHTVELTRRELARRAEEFRRQLAQGDLLFSRNARELYDLLLGPAEAELKGKRRLVVVPDDRLWELPFQALQPRAGSYLVERCAVTYAPSLAVLLEMTRRRAARPRVARRPATLLAFGNPLLGDARADQARGGLMHGDAPNSLPEAERQVRALAAVYGPRHSRVYTGAAAREERLKREAGSFSVLHLATHGTLDDASPMYSNVMLARGQGGEKAAGEDGLLEAWELMNLHLDAELVVLSACETARGRVTPGEGLIGLSWALFVAGSPVTVVSQWKVESASTTELMVDFHRHLQMRFSRAPGAAEMTKAEALRLAALRLLRNPRYAHPFYWAGFVMIGDGNQ
ncbi:MAG TPA: CHAT domain-containing tetratricopeptide repeat protein [Pyrinomonadaceae bacterium]|jgi:CHAT domain-containing protein/tetratricopeptide (TPR) repeat protein